MKASPAIPFSKKPDALEEKINKRTTNDDLMSIFCVNVCRKAARVSKGRTRHEMKVHNVMKALAANNGTRNETVVYGSRCLCLYEG